MRRREFLGAVISGMAAFPPAARSQEPKIPLIGYLSGRSARDSARVVAAFRQGLAERGYVEGKNVAINYLFADGHYERLPELAKELVSRNVAAILATGGGAPSGRAAKGATSTIPIVFIIGGDPVSFGLVPSLNRPGGNITGVSFLINGLIPKQIEALNEVMAKGRPLGFLVNPESPYSNPERQSAEAAAAAVRRSLVVASAHDAGDFAAAYATLVTAGVGGLLLASEPTFNGKSDRLAALSARHALPTVSPLREFPVAGGLMSYGTSITDAHRLAGRYVARILGGEKPADLPVQQSVKVELVLNLKTAKALGIDIPPTLLAIADEVIE